MLDERSKHLRRLCLRALRAKGSGHLGSAFSLIEIMRVLYDDVKEKDDKIILSKGHGALALYAILVDKGHIREEELDYFCKKNGKFGAVGILGGHPAPHIPTVPCHTGSLGHGLSIGVGLAIAAKMKDYNHRIFVIVGDGECNEGSIWEAAMCASKHKLDNLTVIIDRNGMQSAGEAETIQPMESLAAKWKAFGFLVHKIDGHNIKELQNSLLLGQCPKAIIAHTIKGKGISFAENALAWHHPYINAEQFAKMDEELS